MHVLVTGGAGFIGSHVVRALWKAGHRVTVLDDLSTGSRARVGDTALVVGDVRDADVVRQALQGMDAVCHQAAKVGLERGTDDLPDYVSRNDLGTAVLLREAAAVGVRRLVLASSMVVYGEGAYTCPTHGLVPAPPRRRADLDLADFEPHCAQCDTSLAWASVDEDAVLDPRNAYAATKVAQEHLCASWARATDASATALRYHNVYGPGMPRDTPYAGVGAVFRTALLRGEAPRVFEDGGQTRDFVHVRDVAQANLRALEAEGRAGRLLAYNVASGTPRTVLDLARALADALDGPAPVVTRQYRLGDVRHVVASSDRARVSLGFRAAVGFAAGVAELAHEGEQVATAEPRTLTDP